MKLVKKTLIVMGVCTLTLIGLGFQSHSAFADPGKKVTKNKGGPPPWAPAHGYRAKFRYYPKQRVYYHPEHKQYFWVEAGTVKVGLKLPDWIKISGSGVEKELNTDKPTLVYFK